jgi:hypothetical protein
MSSSTSHDRLSIGGEWVPRITVGSANTGEEIGSVPEAAGPTVTARSGPPAAPSRAGRRPGLRSAPRPPGFADAVEKQADDFNKALSAQNGVAVRRSKSCSARCSWCSAPPGSLRTGLPSVR